MKVICAAFVAVTFFIIFPFAASAQTGGGETPDLRATIREALLADPRSASLSGSEVERMVTALSEQAEKQGMTPYDITWRPESTEGSGAWDPSACTNPSGFLCALSTAFGFTGPDGIVAAGLGLLAAALLFVVGSLIEIHRKRRTLAARPTSPAGSLYQ